MHVTVSLFSPKVMDLKMGRLDLNQEKEVGVFPGKIIRLMIWVD
ncbi:MAG: hypothetical protein ACJAU0_001234 [Flavobacteriales bacterium]|jgi:hypothetical protein